MNDCKWISDDDQEICCNADCPCVADFCPVTYWPEICRFREAPHRPGESVRYSPDEFFSAERKEDI